MSAIAKKKKWPRKNLGELLNFLEEQHPEGLSLYALAERMKMERGGVSNMFRKDDMKLSKAEEIARRYGYELRLFFPIRRYDDGYIPQPPKIQYNNAGNLSGLVKYIQDSEYSVSFVAEKTGVAPIVLHHAFKTGNIKISTLNALLDHLGLCVIWKFIPNEKNAKK